MRIKQFCCTAALALVACALPAAAQRPLGDSRVIATLPATPGFPEGIAVRGDQFYVSGPADPGIYTPSAVSAFSLTTGALTGTFPVTLQPVLPMKGLSVIAFGPDGAAYVPEPYMGVILRMELNGSNSQSVYAGPFPGSPQTGTSLLNDLAFDDEGNLFVTDSQAATVYRVPAGGGAPSVWIRDLRLAGAKVLPIGVNGARIDKSNRFLYVTVTAQLGSLDGVIYRLPIKRRPTILDLREFHRYPFNGGSLPAGPDGIAFGSSGKMYVALAGTNEISVLRPDGTEEVRYRGPAASGTGSIPWANPANIAFNDVTRSLLVTNHASLVQPVPPTHPEWFVVFDVFVDDTAQPLN